MSVFMRVVLVFAASALGFLAGVAIVEAFFWLREFVRARRARRRRSAAKAWAKAHQDVLDRCPPPPARKDGAE